MKFYAYLTVAVMVVLLLAEFSPEAVNAFLILLLVGVVLGRAKAFEGLVATLSNVAGEGSKK